MIDLSIIEEIKRQYAICLENIDGDTTIDYRQLSEFLWLQICILDVLIHAGNPDFEIITEYMKYFDNEKEKIFN